ncbi:hypothetical protein [Actinacidiphila acididurans]|uniref:DUF3558 domain-containing protein n=1 Tax=Actinacidiphila acididurans TaxID=2784346 RepID=A0ABS2U6D3_9ACTN|nr:hypothetical protein [Actinacidiphila acididurans]MBM9510577.1 hypothetical protein [Actinacidiphila acididurans]
MGAAVAALAMAGLSGCGGHGSASATASDGKQVPAGTATVSPAPPGKYQTLPQPCVAVSLDSLQHLVPGLPDYSGTESLTYDTDRRVGCRWQSRTSDGTARSLSVDLVRVVSYDPAISDEVQAQDDFSQQATAAHIPAAVGTPSGTPAGNGNGSGASTMTGPSGGAGTPGSGSGGSAGSSGSAGATASASPGAGGSNGSGAGQDLSPRRLSGVGNDAFLDDVLKGRSRRDVTVVFRTANVLVTVVYSESVGKGATAPHSDVLQQGAQDVATQLEHKVKG